MIYFLIVNLTERVHLQAQGFTDSLMVYAVASSEKDAFSRIASHYDGVFETKRQSVRVKSVSGFVAAKQNPEAYQNLITFEESKSYV